MSDVEKPTPTSPIHEEADDEASLEIESGRPDTDEESAAGDAEDDNESRASTELSDAATVDILWAPSRSTTPEIEIDDEVQSALGLIRSRGFSDDDDDESSLVFNVVTVHGLRDDHRTAWKSKSGKPWLRDRLFENRLIRQLDYFYATDESARIFQRDGIKAEARNLLRLYSEEKRRFPQDKVDRPIIWVCHDIGGTIVKQVLVEAAQAVLAEDYDDVETWEHTKEVHRRVSIFSTAIVFLGCPHRAESVDVLEDELYNLMSLPGPHVRKGIMRKIKDIAHQVNDVNIRALDGNIFSRLSSINVFYLADLPQQSKTEEEPPMHETEQPKHRDQADNSGPCIEFLTPPASPFSRYTLTTGHWLETRGRHSQSIIDHAGLVRGDEEVDEDKSWVTKFRGILLGSYYPLDVSRDFIQLQTSLLSLAPSTRYPSVHMDPSLPVSSMPAFLNWIVNHQNKLKNFHSSLGLRVLHIQGVLDSARTAMISQYLHTFNEKNFNWMESVGDRGTFYFEFHKFDCRRNTIRAMLVTFIGEMAWRDSSILQDGHQLRWMLDNLELYRCWSLSDLFNLFDQVIKTLRVFDLCIFLSCFDNCVEEERAWFLKTVLNQHSHTDVDYRLIISTSAPGSLLKGSVPEYRVLSVNDCPGPPTGFAIDESGTNAGGLPPCLEDLLRRRPALNGLKSALEDLIDECQQAPHLGYRILDWLGRFGRGTSGSISTTIAKLRPVTPGSVLNVVVGSLSLEKRAWAVLVHRWVKHAVEPLTVEALGHALAMSSSSPDDMSLQDIDYEDLSDDIRKIFSGIIVTDGRDLKFLHESFYDAVMVGLEECKDAEPPIAHGAIAETCLRYLMHTQVQPRYRKLSVDNYGGDTRNRPLFLPRDDLLEYAVQHWAEHYHLAVSHRPTVLALEFFRNPEARNRWSEAHYLLSNPFTRIQWRYYSPLPLMAALGLDDVVAHQIEHEKGSESFHRDGWFAIKEAATHGHRSTLCMLLDSVQADESGLCDALATSSNNEEVLVSLVNKAVSMSNFCWPESILTRAILSGSDSVVSAILKTRLDLNQEPESFMDPPLRKAILWGRESVVKLLLKAGADPNVRDHYGRTLLRRAVQMCQPEILQTLLGYGASLDDKYSKVVDQDDEDNGLSLVNNAIHYCDAASLKVLLDANADFKGGDPDARVVGLRCPIINAAELSRGKCLRLLVEKGADPLTQSERGSVLYLICNNINNQIDNCRLLLEKGADPNQTYPDKMMILNRVLRTNNREMLKLFIEYGAKLDSLDTWDGDAPPETPLSFAARQCSFDMLKALLDHGAPVNYVPQGADSPLFAAAWRGDDIKKVELLLEAGADIHWTRESDGWTPLLAAYDQPAIVSLLLKYGADVETQSVSGTVLMMAARWGFLETLKTLIAHRNPRPNLDAEADYTKFSDCHGETALVLAVKNKEYDCANCLVEAGAKMSENWRDAKTLLELLDSGHEAEASEKLLKACLKSRLKVDRVDENGNTALHGIRSSTPVSLIQLLIDSGAPVDMPNAAGLTPLVITMQCGNLDAVELLLSKCARATVCGPSFGSLLFLACDQRAAGAPSSKIIHVLKLLIKAKADPNAPGPEPSRPCLLYTAISTDRYESDRHKLVRYLVEDAGVHVDAPDGAQLHPIIAAVQKRDCQLLNYLMRRGANVCVADSQGRRITHHAIWMDTGNLMRYRLLAKGGADLQAKDKYGRTLLHLAAGFGYSFEIAWLFRHVPNLDVNVRDGDGWTPLMWACKLDSTNNFAVEELKNRGADIWSKSIDGKWSALKLACLSNMYESTLQLLEPQESEMHRVRSDGVEETWDPLFHSTEPGKANPGLYCESCLLDITGPRYECTTCDLPYDLCFKCFPNAGTMYGSDHQFGEYIAPETAASTPGELSEAGDRSLNRSEDSESTGAGDDDSEESKGE